MRRKTIREHLNQIGMTLLGASFCFFCAWRFWAAITTGKINGRGSLVYDWTLNPFRFWVETILSGLFAAIPFILLMAWAIHQLAGAMGWRELSRSEKR